MDRPERGVRLSQLVVDGQRSFRKCFRLWSGLVRWSTGIFVRDRVTVRKTDVCEGEIGVPVGRRLELLDRLLEIFPGSPVPVISAFQVRLVRFVVFGISLRE